MAILERIFFVKIVIQKLMLDAFSRQNDSFIFFLIKKALRSKSVKYKLKIHVFTNNKTNYLLKKSRVISRLSISGVK